jgi:hypothetical protein
MTDVGTNWQRVHDQVAEVDRKAGRESDAVRIVAVSKTKPVDLIQQAILAGATNIGENYVQEAAEKISCITAPVTWHMIGHLQRNKAGRAADLFDLIHTLDSSALGEALARHGERRERPVRALIEVNIAGETTKHGVAANGVEALLATLADRRWLFIDGLMTVPPAGQSPEDARPYFRRLRELRDRLVAHTADNAPLRELSMGMSDDFRVAIEEGATMVRIGRAIFGERR